MQLSKFFTFPTIRFLILSMLLAAPLASQAATRILDTIETRVGDEENRILIHFNIPVRYVSILGDDGSLEYNIQLQPVITRDVSLEDLLVPSQLTWKPSNEIPLEKVEFRGQPVGNSQLLVSFASSVKGLKVQQGKDFYVLEVIIAKPRKVVSVPAEQPQPVAESLTEVPQSVYAISLESSTKPIKTDKVPPILLQAGRTAYTTQAVVDGRTINRLRLGFFASSVEAQTQLRAIKKFYPKAWIDRVDAQEVRGALSLGPTDKLPPDIQIQEVPGAQPELTPQQKRMALARRTMTAGEYEKAALMFEAILDEPDEGHAQEARELMGLARERNGQFAHAKAEYRTYLEIYPKGEDADRVRQRLVGLETATRAPKEPLQKEEPKKPAAEWDTYGTFAQHYNRAEIDSPFVDDEDKVTSSEIETFLDFNTRRRGETVDMKARFNGSYTNNLLDNGDGNESQFSDAYVDFEHKPTRSTMSIGRQRLKSSGIPNRFDGLVLGYEVVPDVTMRLVGGLPVESSSDTYLHKEKSFYGVNGDVSNIFENMDLSLYYLSQEVDGLVDRKAAGGEIRYFTPKLSVFGLLDYDLHYSEVNTFMLQSNYTVSDQTHVYMNLDYRYSPLLQTSNALISQNDPITLLPIETIAELQNFYTEDEIYALALDRTVRTRTLSLGATRALYPTLQISGDFTLSNTGGAPASGGVGAIEANGNEFFYTFQMIKNDLLKAGDIGILSLGYSDASTSQTYRVGASSRYPVNNDLRLNPKLNLAYRTAKDSDSDRFSVSPFLQMDYRLRRSVTLELEAGMDWYSENDGADTINYTDYFVYTGYRWDF